MANRPRRKPCPAECQCICHDTGGGITIQHGDHPRCPTKDGLALFPLDLEAA